MPQNMKDNTSYKGLRPAITRPRWVAAYLTACALAAALVWGFGGVKRAARAGTVLSEAQASGATGDVSAEEEVARLDPRDFSTDRLPASDAPERFLAAESEGRESTVTLVHVRALDADGRPVKVGSIEYFAGGRNPELRTGSLHGRVDLTHGEGTLRIPPDRRSIYVVCTTPDHAPAIGSIPNMRGVGKDFAASGTVERTLDLTMGSTSLEGWISGTIYVDDRPTVPDDLYIKALVSHTRGAAASVGSARSVVAILNRYRGTYTLGPLTSAPYRVRVDSPHTRPEDLTLPTSVLASREPFDLRLTAGRSIAFRFEGEASGTPITGREIEIERHARLDRAGSSSSFYPAPSSARTDSAGGLTVGGLVEGDFLRLRDGGAVDVSESAANQGPGARTPSPSGSPVLLEEHLSQTSTWDGVVTVLVPEPLLEVEARLSGAVPPAAEFPMPEPADGRRAAGQRLVLCLAEPASYQSGRTGRSLPLFEHMERFVVAAKVGSDQVLWLERGGMRVSEPKFLTVAPSGHAGLVFQPRRWGNVLVRWLNAPLGMKLVIAEGQVARPATLLAMTLSESDGQARLAYSRGAGIAVDLHGAGDLTIQRRLQPSDVASGEVTLDLGGDSPRRTEIWLGSERCDSSGSLAMVALGATGTGRTMAMVPVRSGHVHPLSLPSGRYFARLDGQHDGPLCGVVHWDASGNSPAELRFEGELRALPASVGQGARQIEVKAVGAVDLLGAVPLQVRCFGLPTPEATSTAPRPTVWWPEGIEFLALR